VKLFMNQGCTLSGADWTQVGLDLLRKHLPEGKRDFLLPIFTKGGDSFLSKRMDYNGASAASRWLSRVMEAPQKTSGGRWKLALDELLLPGDLGKLFTEHSERHLLVSIAAEAGVPQEHRSYLGRWGIDEYAGSEYMLSSRQIICDIQQKVVKYLMDGKPGHDESDVIGEIAEMAKTEGFDSVKLKGRHSVLFGDPSYSGRNLHQVPARAAEVPAEGLDEVAEEQKAAAEAPGVPTPYWICILGKSQHRRLHRAGGCALLKWKCELGQDVQVLSSGGADSICENCWPAARKNHHGNDDLPLWMQEKPVETAEVAQEAESEDSSNCSSSSWDEATENV
jgi:hypothetical protein